MASEVGRINRRVTFRRQTRDENNEAAGYEDVVTRSVRIQPLKGGEAVQASRLAGRQPVIIRVQRDSITKQIDNGWQVKDARAAADSPPAVIAWDVTSAIETEDLQWVEIQAVQLKAGDVA